MTTKEAAKILKALADSNRLRLLAALRGGPLCVCQLMGVLGISQPAVSKHLTILKGAGLVSEEQRGKRSFYSLPTDYPSAGVRTLLDALLTEVKSDPTLVEDQRMADFMREFRIETMDAVLNLRKKRLPL